MVTSNSVCPVTVSDSRAGPLLPALATFKGPVKRCAFCPPTALTQEEVVGSLVHWVLHGHQTLVSALQFVLHLLANFQDHQQIVFAEVNRNITVVSQSAFFFFFFFFFSPVSQSSS